MKHGSYYIGDPFDGFAGYCQSDGNIWGLSFVARSAVFPDTLQTGVKSKVYLGTRNMM